MGYHESRLNGVQYDRPKTQNYKEYGLPVGCTVTLYDANGVQLRKGVSTLNQQVLWEPGK